VGAEEGKKQAGPAVSCVRLVKADGEPTFVRRFTGRKGWVRAAGQWVKKRKKNKGGKAFVHEEPGLTVF